MERDELSEFFGPIISRYTRAQAIEDGVLVDAGPMAREAGIKHPVALTRRVWDEIVKPSDADRKNGQSETGRLWDILWMFRVCAGDAGGSAILFRLIVRRNNRRRIVTLKALCGPGDDASPVVTILMPDED